jgi:hypothetical protein
LHAQGQPRHDDITEATQRVVALLSTDPANGTALYEAQQRGMLPVEAVFRLGTSSQRLRVLEAAARMLRRSVPLGQLINEHGRTSTVWGRAEALSPLVARARQRFFALPVSLDGLAIPPGAAEQCRVLPTRTSSDTLLVQSEEQLQFMYLLSTVLREATASAPRSASPQLRVLREIGRGLELQIRCYWDVLPAWHWSGPFHGIRARLTARLADSARVRTPPWYGAVLDHDLYLLFISADVLAAHHARPDILQLMPQQVARLVEIRSMARRVLATRVTASDDGHFLFDYGRWSTNPSYAYAGCHQVKPLPDQPCPVDSVATDVSHALRWPWWLRSFGASWPASHPERARAAALAERYARQFDERVLYFTPEGWPLFRNYVDGRDGWYRLREFPSHPWGHGPSTLTGAMRYGSWALVAGASPRLARAQRTFCDVVSSPDSVAVRHRTRWYGSASDVPDSGGVGVVDLYGASSPFAHICRVVQALGYDAVHHPPRPDGAPLRLDAPPARAPQRPVATGRTPDSARRAVRTRSGLAQTP